ncbi:MAG TPA: GNAT family N-acetyltransferase [Ilumatobacteraceae bacterium]|nr:GNAT family N-acetyltransferase [Ilumatobacteraceae bacterium]
MPEIRPFLRQDREQLTYLVNAHVKAVIPGCSVPVATLLSQMERDPGEYIVDPWVIERETWVAIEEDRLVAAVHLHRYGGDAAVGPALRDAAAINWLVCWPANLDAGSDLMRHAVQRLDRWRPRITVVDMSLPAPLVYGIHDAWPHLDMLVREAGFSDADGRTELQFVIALDALAAPGEPPIDGLTLRRRLHEFGAAFAAMLNGREVGLLEVDDDFTRHGSMLRNDGWADISNVGVVEESRGVGVASWLLRHAAAWLRMGGSRNLVSYLGDDEVESPLHAWHVANGFTELNRTRRGWTRTP